MSPVSIPAALEVEGGGAGWRGRGGPVTWGWRTGSCWGARGPFTPHVLPLPGPSGGDPRAPGGVPGWSEGPSQRGRDCPFCPLPTSSLLRGQLTIVSGLELRLHLRDHWALPRVTFGVESSPVALADGCGPLGQVSSCRKYLEGLKA